MVVSRDFEVTTNDKTVLEIIDTLHRNKHIRFIEDAKQPATITSRDNSFTNTYVREEGTPAQPRLGKTIEYEIEAISRQYFGFCEERKSWDKELKKTIKELGHDEVLEAFREWAPNADRYIRKPVTYFLKNARSHVTAVSRQTVSNPYLDSVEKQIAIISDNKVFFSGDHRIRLAILIKDNGVSLVLKAFNEFYPTLDDRSIPWAARQFLQQADIMIYTIKAREQQEAKQATLLQQTYQDAKNSAVEDTDEELEEGL